MALKLDKKERSFILIYGIILVLYILAFALIPFPKGGTAWTAFVFTVLAILISFAISAYAFQKHSAVGKIYGFPIFRIGVCYMIAQFFVGVVLCLIGIVVTVPFWITLLLSLLMLGATAIAVIILGNVRDVVVNVEEKTTENIKKLTLFNISIAGIIDVCEDEAVKAGLEELGEMFQYSDPVSSEATREIEERIRTELAVLRALVDAAASEAVIKQTKQIKHLLAERNRICQANK